MLNGTTGGGRQGNNKEGRAFAFTFSPQLYVLAILLVAIMLLNCCVSLAARILYLISPKKRTTTTTSYTTVIYNSVSTWHWHRLPYTQCQRDNIIVLGLGLGIGALLGYQLRDRMVKSASTVSAEKPSVITNPTEVVNIDGKLQILEHTGNASNGDAGVSIAQVTVTEPMTEAVQIPGFDEYVMVTSGTMIVYVESGRDAHGDRGPDPSFTEGQPYKYTFPGLAHTCLCTCRVHA